jgi:hypothetical protein
MKRPAVIDYTRTTDPMFPEWTAAECSKCVFFAPKSKSTTFYREDDGAVAQGGSCRINPPDWPAVAPWDWCGKCETRNAKDEAVNA